MDVSLIVCSINDAKFHRTATQFSQSLAGAQFEIIRIPDARSLAEGYNRGIDRAQGRIILMSHDDVELAAPRLWDRIRGHMEHCDVLGVVGTRYYSGDTWGLIGVPYLVGQVANPAPAPGGAPFTGPFGVSIFGLAAPRVDGIHATDGLFLAARRTAFDRVRFDAETFDGFHAYDVDFTYRVYRAGLRLAVATDLAPIHGSYGTFDEKYMMYYKRLDEKHRATVPRRIQRQYRFAFVQVADRAELLSVMLPAEYPLDLTPAPPGGINVTGVSRGAGFKINALSGAPQT
jgi:glycosyltransferase involved in cell wall biosynthesis